MQQTAKLPCGLQYTMRTMHYISLNSRFPDNSQTDISRKNISDGLPPQMRHLKKTDRIWPGDIPMFGNALRGAHGADAWIFHRHCQRRRTKGGARILFSKFHCQ